MIKSELFWQTYLNLEKELLQVAKYIFITDEITYYKNNQIASRNYEQQLNVFSPHIADLLIRTCVEIEAISKELYFELGGTKDRGATDLYFDTDCLGLINQKCKINNKVVMITSPLFHFKNSDNLSIRPLKNAHKRQGAKWAVAYQAVKHDRYISFSKATVKNLLHAIGALYLLNIYHRKIYLRTKFIEVHKIDFSFGSSVFAIKRPEEKYVIDVINSLDVSGVLESGESPFILKYTNDEYNQIVNLNANALENLRNYWINQPELKDKDFEEKLNLLIEQEKKDPNMRVNHILELCRYRINKKIPSNLPFEIRKQLFINSDEWNSYFMRNMNNRIKEEELNEENINLAIDSAATFAYFELGQRLENNRIHRAINEGLCELILDMGDIKYE